MSGARRAFRPLGVAFRTAGSFGRFWGRHPLLMATGVALGAIGFTFASVQSLAWMETENFCSRCHTMTPQVSAHAASKHSKVECAECHVGPGLGGLVRAKMGGMRQTIQLVLGDYARPIPPAADVMPAADAVCGRCHDVRQEREDILLLRSHYQDDEPNTEQRVALTVRVGGDPQQPNASGIHWHAVAKVEYVARDAAATVIDWVGVERPDGTRAEFIAANAVAVSGQAGAQAAQLRSTGDTRKMSCYDCHNRVGHEFVEPGQAIDQAIAAGRIDRELPFIKKKGSEVVGARYSSVDDALNAIRGLEDWYHTTYPDLWLLKSAALSSTFVALSDIYRETSHPEMNAAPAAYPNNLGHAASNGCFRCHDGGHYLVKDGKLSNEPIASQCSACHSFPTAGTQASDLAVGPAPQTHANTLWVFKHGAMTKGLDPGQVNCAACHSQSYCSNCHSSGAIAVKHDDMLFDHAQVVRRNTDRACSYCHQKPFCVRCHAAASK